MAILLQDLIEEILCRLPVNSLKRFRSVCKSWCSLIDSEAFVKLHLRKSIVSCSNSHILLMQLEILSADMKTLDMGLSTSIPSFCDDILSFRNSCNGLVLVTWDDPVLWNPFARNYQILPRRFVRIPLGSGYYPSIEYGLAYDSRNDDYKVLRVLECKDRSSNDVVFKCTQLYSLRMNSWKIVDHFPCASLVWGGISCAHVHGALHTLQRDAVKVYGSKIMAFSVESETHYELMMPPGLRMNDVLELSLDALGGCLCLICRYESATVLWVMKEYGVKESWSKLLEISQTGIAPNGSVKPLAYSKDKERVLLASYGRLRKLFWYDLRKKTVAEVPLLRCFYAISCVESLVSLGIPC